MASQSRTGIGPSQVETLVGEAWNGPYALWEEASPGYQVFKPEGGAVRTWTSEWLLGLGAGANWESFSIPDDATIDGIQLTISVLVLVGNTADLGAALLGYSEDGHWPLATKSGVANGGPADVVFGGPTDDWGGAVTWIEANSAAFGFAVQAWDDEGVQVLGASITIYYTESGGEPGNATARAFCPGIIA